MLSSSILKPILGKRGFPDSPWTSDGIRRQSSSGLARLVVTRIIIRLAAMIMHSLTTRAIWVKWFDKEVPRNLSKFHAFDWFDQKWILFIFNHNWLSDSRIVAKFLCLEFRGQSSKGGGQLKLIQTRLRLRFKNALNKLILLWFCHDFVMIHTVKLTQRQPKERLKRNAFFVPLSMCRWS